MLKLSASAGAIEISQPLIAPIAALEPLNLLQAERRDLPLGELIVVLGGLRRGARRWKASELGLMHEFELLWIVVVARVTRRIRVEWARTEIILKIDMHLFDIQCLIIVPSLLVQPLGPATIIHDLAADESHERLLVLLKVLLCLIG